MREVILIIVVGAISLAALARPLWGLYGYTWFALMRPDVLAWSYGALPYSMVLAVCTLLGSLRYLHLYALIFTNPFTQLLLVFQVPLVISVFTAIVPDLCYHVIGIYERMLLMAVVIVVIVRTAGDMKRLLMVMGFSLGLLASKFGIYGVMAGGVRFAAGYGGMLSDNNDLALAFGMSVPLCWYLRNEFRSRLVRLGVLAMIFCTIAAVVMTYSRSGAVTLGVVMTLIAVRSRKKAAVLALFAVLAAPVIYMVGDSYADRIATVADPKSEASSYSRIALAEAAIRMWKDYPLFGVGFGGDNCRLVLGRYTAVKETAVLHNTYLQVLVDSGTLAFLMYIVILFGTIAWLGVSIRRARRENPDLACIPLAIQTSLIAFAVGSLFLSRVVFDITYMLICAAAAWWQIARVRAASTAEVREAPAEPRPAEEELGSPDLAY